MPEAKPARIQLRRTAGWRMPANTIKVDRTTRWGNPRHVKDVGSAKAAVELLEQDIRRDGAFTALVRGKAVTNTVEDIQRELGGRNLACWCPASSDCHVDLLLKIANGTFA